MSVPKLTVAGLLLFSLALPTCGLNSAVLAEDGDAEFSYATGYFKKQRWKYAAEAFNDFLEKYPRHSRAHMAQLYYGLALNSLEEFGPARDALRTFMKEYPTSQNLADAMFRIGECSYGLRDYKAAVAEFTEYLSKYKEHNLRPWATLMLGESYNELSEWKRAEAVLQPLTQNEADSQLAPDATFAIGVSLQGQKRTDEAIATFERVVKMESPALTHRAYARIGTTYFSNRNYEQASVAYDQIVRQFPEKSMAATAALQSGICQFQLKNFEAALARLQTVPEDSPAALHAGMWTGLCFRETGDFAKARESLSAAFAKAESSPLAPEILFNRAQVELLDEQKSTAAQMFVDLADRWPKDRRVAESLYNAAQLRTELSEHGTAEKILTRLQTEFPEWYDSPNVKALRGRLALYNGDAAEAVQLLKAATETKGTDQESIFRQYHLIRALHRSGNHQEVIDLFQQIRPALSQSWAVDFQGAASLAAMSSLELKKYDLAKTFASDFIIHESDPAKKADALAARAVALSHLKQYAASRDDLQQLVETHPSNSQTWFAVLQSAEAAWGAKEFAAAASAFDFALTPKASEIAANVREAAASGAAWSRYKLGDYNAANDLFRSIIRDFPDSERAHEAAFMEANCQFELGNEAAASALFLNLYDRLNKLSSPSPDSLNYLLQSGQMHARLEGKAGNVDAADKMWERMAERFADSPELPSLLDSWAYLNLENQRFDRSDEIYRRLLTQFPDSQFAGQARLSLAESEMQAENLDVALKEFTAIAEHEKYGNAEKEAALYHVIDIHAARRNWMDVVRYGDLFAEKFSSSPHAPKVQLLYGEAMLDKQLFGEARDKLAPLRQGLLNGSLPLTAWSERVWIVLAEVALAEKQYAEIDDIEKEYLGRVPQPQLAFQLNDVQGRRWKNQPPPDFAKAREYFERVTLDEAARGTETAARCQFLIGETHLLEQDYKSARKAYYRVYLNYPYDDWRQRGLFQAAGCEIALRDLGAAERSLMDLLEDFPNSPLAAEAKQKLQELQASK